MMINGVMIPLIINKSIYLEDFVLKSERKASILRRLFTFILINTLFIPIIGFELTE
jgi:hypothetical protein